MWLIVGGDSEIGAAAERGFKAASIAVQSTTRRREQAGADRIYLDLARPLDEWQIPPRTECVCLCAAVARLAACADNPQASSRVNVLQTLALVDLLVKQGIYVLFLSTNQVFNGEVPDVEADTPTAPASEYGRQKACAEAGLRERLARGAPVAILRLAKVVSCTMPLLHGWIDTLRAGRQIRAFHDMTMAPTPIERVVDAIHALMRDRALGIFQLTGPKDETYADIARYAARKIGADEALVKSVSASSIGLPEGSTPRYTTLNSRALRERYGLSVPGAWEVIDQVIAAKG